MSHCVALLGHVNISILDAIARTQLSLITLEQVEMHFTARQRRHLVATGQLIRVRRGVYRMPGGPTTWEHELLAVMLLTENKYVISHRAAMRWHGLGNVWKAPILEFSIDQQLTHRLDDITVHNAPLPEHHIVRHGQFLITSIPRTIVDAVAVSPLEKVDVALDHALSRNFIKIDHLEMTANDVRRPGRPKFATVDKLISDRREHSTESWLQRKTLSWIRSAGLPLPEVEYPIPTADCTYHVDLAYPQLKLGIECNGFTDHGHRTAFDNDARRLAAIAAAGLRVMPVTTKTIEHEFIHNLRTAFAAQKRLPAAR